MTKSFVLIQIRRAKLIKRDLGSVQDENAPETLNTEADLHADKLYVFVYLVCVCVCVCVWCVCVCARVEVDAVTYLLMVYES